jgi:uncharacterized protein (TIGR02453 family)
MVAEVVVATGAYFTAAFFQFLRELKVNNRRDWFAANKARYQRDVEAPMQQFILDLGDRLHHISPRFRADPRRVGGSMFRIYRDTRFSADKSPFKPWVAARFAHSAPGDGSVPAFYLHLEPGDSVGGGGIYHPDPASLLRVRQRIAAAPREWRAVLKTGLAVQGDSLKRVPPGFEPRHRFADDLKRKDHYVLTSFTTRDVTGSRFLDLYTETCERTAPLVAFLTRALGLRW